MLEDIKKTILSGRVKKIAPFVQESIDEGDKPNDILAAMIDTMGVVGNKFQNKEIFVSEMLAAALTMKEGVKVLTPYLSSSNTAAFGTFIIGTVAGDLHDIGKNLVALMVESAGFDVVDLGIDVPADKFVEAINEHPDCHVVGVSALLTTTMEAMRVTVKAIIDAGLQKQVKIMVGGAPITAEFAAEIGADAYTPDAASAADKAKELAEAMMK